MRPVHTHPQPTACHVQHAYVAEVEDLSSLSYLEFWQRMAKAGRVWRHGPQVGVQVLLAAEEEGQKERDTP